MLEINMAVRWRSCLRKCSRHRGSRKTDDHSFSSKQSTVLKDEMALLRQMWRNITQSMRINVSGSGLGACHVELSAVLEAVFLYTSIFQYRCSLIEWASSSIVRLLCHSKCSSTGKGNIITSLFGYSLLPLFHTKSDHCETKHMFVPYFSRLAAWQYSRDLPP